MELDIEKFHIIGNSLGGYLAIKYAKKYPNAIHNIFLYAPLTKSYSQSMVVNMIKLALEINVDNKYRKARKTNILSEMITNAPSYIKHGRFASKLELKKSDIPSKIPAIVILPGDDRLVDNNYSRQVFGDTKNVQIVELEGEKHSSMLRNRKVVLTAINKFI